MIAKYFVQKLFIFREFVLNKYRIYWKFKKSKNGLQANLKNKMPGIIHFRPAHPDNYGP
jgi:hypothetical protein